MYASDPENRNDSNSRVVIILSIFVFGVFAPTWIQSARWYEILVSNWVYELRVLVQPLFRMFTILLGSWLLLGVHPKRLCSALALNIGLKKLLIGSAIGVLFSAPLLIVGFWGGLGEAIEYRSLPFTTLGAGIFEELFFRAFAFGFLVRLVHWRVWPAAILTGVLFAAAHLHIDRIQAVDLTNQFLQLAMLASVGAFYAWIYAQWEFNIYLPITMHALFNLSWQVFEMNESPMGSAGLIVATTLVFAVPTVVTIRKSRQSVRIDPLIS